MEGHARATWALRKPLPKRGKGGQILNAFEDWKIHGDQISPVQKVASSEGGGAYFVKEFRYKSSKFKNFWLREEVDEDAKFQDRTLYSTEGWRMVQKTARKPNRMGELASAEAARLAKTDEELTKLYEQFYGVPLKSKPTLHQLNQLWKDSDPAEIRRKEVERKLKEFTHSKRQTLIKGLHPPPNVIQSSEGEVEERVRERFHEVRDRDMSDAK